MIKTPDLSEMICFDNSQFPSARPSHRQTNDGEDAPAIRQLGVTWRPVAGQDRTPNRVN